MSYYSAVPEHLQFTRSSPANSSRNGGLLLQVCKCSFISTGGYSWYAPCSQDVDELSINSARINVDRNGLQDRIDIFPVNPDGPILIPIAVNSEAS
jgi:hypothetical protein